MITIAYDILFRVTVRHLFYQDGRSPDFTFRPTPACQETLDQYGLIFKTTDYGFTVLARVVPGTNPPQLFVPIDPPGIRFSFLMTLRNPYFFHFTSFHQHVLPSPERQVLYFSNLRMPGPAHPELADEVSPGPGTYLQLLRNPILNLQYPAPVTTAGPSLEDPFGRTYSPMPVLDLPGTDTTDQLQINFKEVEKVTAGRYLIKDPSLSADLPLYYEPRLNGMSVFGLIDLYNDTLTLTDPPMDEIDTGYKFLNGNQLNRSSGGLDADYTIIFTAARYELRYRIRLKPETVSAGLINPANLTIHDNLGGLTFTPSIQPEEVTFTADALLTWSETPQDFELRHNAVRLKTLPNPSVFHPVKREINTPGDPADDILYYEVFIYV